MNKSKKYFATTVAIVLLIMMVVPAISQEPREPWKDARLFDAVAAGRKDIVEVALAAGKDPNTRSPYWGSLLMYATAKQHLDIIKLLLAHGADPKAKGNEALLLGAINAKRMDILKCLVEAGALVTKPKDARYFDDFLVAAGGNGEIVEYLLQHGVDPKGTESICGETALQMAAARGDVDVMKMLLDAGADINHRDWNGMSALMLACQKGQQAAVEFLLAHGADPSFKDGYDRTAETFASQLKGENAEKLRVLCAGKKQ